METPSKYIHGFHQRKFGERRMLPHLKRYGGTYFVTYRLADSLPQSALVRLEEEIAQVKFPRDMSPDEQNLEMQRERFRRIEAWLDAGAGSCCLRRTDIANVIVENLRFFGGVRYELRAWVVMPNHVHVLVAPTEPYSLGEIVKTWKQFTSRRAKEILGRDWPHERFWQTEFYDRWMRDGEERERVVRYIHANPVKARLCVRPEEWPWSSAYVAT